MLQPLVKYFREILASYSHDRSHWAVATATKITIILTILSVGLIVWRWGLLPLTVPLWYARAWGEERLAPRALLFLLPAGNIVWMALVLLVSKYLAKTYAFFIQIMYVAAGFVSVLSSITLLKILFLLT